MQQPADAVNYRELRRVIRAALVADALDSLGLRSQCLAAGIVPLAPGQVLVGRAFPVTVISTDSVPDKPYRGLLRALDALSRDDVFVVSAGARQDVALWGELLSTAAMAHGAAGAICDGYARDTALVRELGFSVFSRGCVPYDINGRLEVTGFGDPTEVSGVTVCLGDLIVGDDDGVVVVPRAVQDEVAVRALEKATGESGFRDAVRNGMAPSEAFDRFKVL